MVKDTNVREKVTLTKEQSKEIEDFANAYNTSKSKILACLVSVLLSYKAGEVTGDLLRQALFENFATPKGSPSGGTAPKVAPNKPRRSKGK